MIQYNNKQYRNLEEQVRENQRLIAAHYERDRVLQNYGIIVVGSVNTVEELPDPLTYTGSYGDAYSVGVEGEELTFYIFTRPNEAIGETTNRWLDLGKLAIPGPQGPEGPVGPIGETGQSTKWHSAATSPAGSGFRNGDQWLNTKTGEIYEYKDNVWTVTGTIKGPVGDTGPRGPIGPTGNPGPQGPVGPAGTPSPVVDILGQLENVDALEAIPPSSVPTNAGYLIPIGGANHLFIIIGGQWSDSGQWGGGATITVGGEVVSNFDADTKLDKVPNQQYLKAYCVGNNGTEMIGVGTSADQLLRRTTNGNVSLPATIGNNLYYAVHKQYVDNLINNLGIQRFTNTIWEGQTTGGTLSLFSVWNSPPFRITYTYNNTWVSNWTATVTTTTQYSQSSAGDSVPIALPLITVDGQVYKIDLSYSFYADADDVSQAPVYIYISIYKQVNNEWQSTTDITITKIEA